MLAKKNPKIGNFKKLHLGCGKKHFQGWLNVDMQKGTADLCFDLDLKKWPLPTGHFGEIHCCHVLEHLKDVQNAMDEIWRVSRNSAKVTIIVPHFSGVADPSPFHRHSFNSQSMNYFTPDGMEIYGKARFKVVSTRIFWYPESADEKYVGKSLKRRIGRLAGKIIDFFINTNIGLFERVWHGWVGGAFEIKWVLEAIK